MLFSTIIQRKSIRLWKYGQALWCSGLVQSTHCTAPSSLLYIVSNYGFRLRFLCLHIFVSVATFLPVFPKLVLQPYRFLIENYLPPLPAGFYGLMPRTSKFLLILKGSLDAISSPTPSLKIQIMCGKVCLRGKGKSLLGIVNKLLRTTSLLTSPSNVLPYYLK